MATLPSQPPGAHEGASERVHEKFEPPRPASGIDALDDSRRVDPLAAATAAGFHGVHHTHALSEAHMAALVHVVVEAGCNVDALGLEHRARVFGGALAEIWRVRRMADAVSGDPEGVASSA